MTKNRTSTNGWRIEAGERGGAGRSVGEARRRRLVACAGRILLVLVCLPGALQAGAGAALARDLGPGTAADLAGAGGGSLARPAAQTAATETLLADDFNRPDGGAVGDGWTEVETASAAAGLQAGRLCVLDASDQVNRPMVWRSFPAVAAGLLVWEFDFDWQRSGDEGNYRLFMQLGEGAQMSDASQDAGVGVNLVWSVIGGVHERLGYRKDGVVTGLSALSGAARLRVEADLDSKTYRLLVNGVEAGAGLPFDRAVPLDTVRWFTDGLNEVNFSGRCFDNLLVEKPAAGETPPAIASTPVTQGAVGQAYAYDVQASGNPAPTFSLPVAPAGMTIDAASGLIAWLPTEAGDFPVTVEASNAAGTDSQSFTISVVPEPTFTCAQIPRIMPLGDSITVGKSSGVDDVTKQVSYRKDLWELLLNSGRQVDFVGGLSNGGFYAGFDADHEGHSGYRDDQIAFNLYDNGGGDWLGTNPAEIILLHIGTNGLTADPADVESILNEVDQYEAANGSRVVVVLARIINQDLYNPTVTQFNENVAAMAQARIAAGDDIVLVDMENGAGLIYDLQPAGDMWDNLHPYASGYAKMAAVWYGALASLLPECPFAPSIYSAPITEATSGAPYGYDVQAYGFPAPVYSLASAPAGMTIDPTTGQIEWLPSEGGDFAVQVQASNDQGSTSQSFTIHVAGPIAPAITSAPLLTGMVGQPYRYDVEASGSPAPVFSLSVSPPGMSIDPASGLIAWVPPADGNYDVTVVATNSAGSASQAFTIAVSGVPACLPGTAAYWKLDENGGTLFDDSVGSRDATFVGSGAPGYAAGQVNGAVDFNGLDQSLRTAGTSNPTRGITVMAWINPDDLSGRDRGILSKKGAFVLEVESVGSELSFTIINGRSFKEFEPDAFPGEDIPTGRWTHVAATFDGSAVTLYINGVAVSREASVLKALGKSAKPYVIGWTSHTAFGIDRYFDGRIDEVAVFDRALTPQEVRQLYEAGFVGAPFC